MLKHLLRWPSERIERRIKGHFELAHWVIVSDSPENYIAWDMIPMGFKKEAGARLHSVIGEIENAIIADKRTVLEFSPADWKEARERVNRALAKHGLSLKVRGSRLGRRRGS